MRMKRREEKKKKKKKRRRGKVTLRIFIGESLLVLPHLFNEFLLQQRGNQRGFSNSIYRDT